MDSLVENLYAEANKIPLNLRCDKLALRHFIKLKSYSKIPAHISTFNLNYTSSNKNRKI